MTGVPKEKNVQKSKAPKVEKKPKPAKATKPDKGKAKAAIASAVWKATEASRTIGKLGALVDTYDEYDTKAETLKEQIGGVKGAIAEDRAEIRRLAHLVNSPQHPTVEKDMKSLAGLERDCERREVKLAGLNEQRTGAKEAMKCAMADIRKIVKEGPGLFEAPAQEGEPTGAGKDESSSPEKTAKQPPQRSAETLPPPTKRDASSNGTNPPSKSPISPDAGNTPPSPMDVDLQEGVTRGVSSDAVDALKAAGIRTLRDARYWMSNSKRRKVNEVLGIDVEMLEQWISEVTPKENEHIASKARQG